MKSIILLLCLVIVSQFGHSQNKRVDVNNIFITNKLSGKSVKLGTSASTLDNFGEFLSADTNYVDKVNMREIMDDSKFLKYTFSDIVFYVDNQNRISEFKTGSSNIEISRKGVFSISPSNSLEQIAKIFPDEVSDAYETKKGVPGNEKNYLAVMIPLYYRPTGHDELVEIDQKIGLLFNPESKFLEVIFIWSRP